MKDPEFQKLAKKFLLGMVIILIFLIPLFIIFRNKFYTGTDIEKKIDNKKTFIVYYIDSRCELCETYKKHLSNIGLKYEIIYKNNTNTPSILRKIGITPTKLTTPSLIYIKKGKLVSTLAPINSKDEIDEYLENNGLIDKN